MFHDAEEYEARAGEAERLAYATRDLILREDMLGLARIYRDYADHLRERDGNAGEWRTAVNG